MFHFVYKVIFLYFYNIFLMLKSRWSVKTPILCITFVFTRLLTIKILVEIPVLGKILKWNRRSIKNWSKLMPLACDFFFSLSLYITSRSISISYLMFMLKVSAHAVIFCGFIIKLFGDWNILSTFRRRPVNFFEKNLVFVLKRSSSSTSVFCTFLVL